MRRVLERGSGHRLLVLALAAAVAALAGCRPGRKTAGEAVFPYIDAVQAENLDLLRCLSSGAPQSEDEFRTWIRSRYAAFDEGKRSGRVELSEDGVAMIKAFGLGTGTLIGISKVASVGGDALQVDTPATFNYDQIDAPRLPEGSTFVVATLPLGAVVTVRVHEGAGAMSLDALKNLTLRWTLKKMPPREGCTVPWGVASVAPIAGSASTTHITWKF